MEANEIIASNWNIGTADVEFWLDKAITKELDIDEIKTYSDFLMAFEQTIKDKLREEFGDHSFIEKIQIYENCLASCLDYERSPRDETEEKIWDKAQELFDEE